MLELLSTQTLVGHHRTPWTVKFHPQHPSMCASGGLAGNVLHAEVIVWDADTGEELRKAQVPNHALSLDFHPNQHVLMIACGKELLVWKYQVGQGSPQPPLLAGHTVTLPTLTAAGQEEETPRPLAQFTQTLRCVAMLPCGTAFVTAMVVPQRPHVGVRDSGYVVRCGQAWRGMRPVASPPLVPGLVCPSC